MPHSSAPLSGAGSAVSGQARRRPLPSTADRLTQLSCRLDELIRDISFRPVARSHHETEERIAEAEAIAAGIRDVFRAPAKAENPPLKRTATGGWW